MSVECTLPSSEDIGAPAATDLANPLPAVPVRRTISLSGTASLTRAMIAALASLRRRYPSYCSRSAQVSSSGLIVVAPIAARITRMDRRTASRKAELAFSIRCQRSATWMAPGSAFVAASP
jgi:hypothetical protein